MVARAGALLPIWQHPALADAAVAGVSSWQWSETPVAFVIPSASAEAPDDAVLLQWANARLGKTQRVHSLRSIDALPRTDPSELSSIRPTRTTT